MAARIQIAFTLPARFRKRGRWHIASCPVLDVVSQGETAARARENLVNALVEFFLSCWERGTIDEVLKQAGFVPAGVAPATRRTPRTQEESVTVPLPFVIAETLARHRAEAV